MNQVNFFSTRKAIAAAIVVLSYAFSFNYARADESVTPSSPATVPAADTAPRPITIKTMVAGGLRNGRVMKIEAGTTEMLSAAQYEKGITLAQKAGTSSSTCLMF